MPEYRFLTGCA